VTTVVAGAVSSDARAPDGPCQHDPMLILSLSRNSYLGNKKSAPVEMAVAEEPPIRNLAILPDPLTSYDDKGTAVEPSRPVRTILGGTAFSDAPVLASGTFTDSLAVGETVVYRVRLETGQRLRVTVDTPAPKSGWHLGSTERLRPD
jgi:Ca-activated chloride channel homolog